MKSNLKKVALAIGIVAFAFVGCKKEMMNQIPVETDLGNSDIQSLTVQTQTENEAIGITYDDASGEMTAANEGLAADYLVETEDFEATQSTPNASGRSHIVNHSFVRCLHKLKLDSVQMRKVRFAMGEYRDCKKSAVTRARAIYANLKDKYQALAKEQVALLRSGDITKAEFDTRIARIRKAFEKELRELQLKEKLGDALKGCHEKFLRQLHSILSDRQWKAFVDCNRK